MWRDSLVGGLIPDCRGDGQVVFHKWLKLFAEGQIPNFQLARCSKIRKARFFPNFKAYMGMEIWKMAHLQLICRSKAVLRGLFWCFSEFI